MQVGTRVKVKLEALEDDIRKILDISEKDSDWKLEWAFYVAALKGMDGIVEGLHPDDDAPVGCLLISWKCEDEAWVNYLNQADNPYGWFENELEVIE